MCDRFRNLSRVEFVITWKCTGRCKHCSAADRKTERMCIDGAWAADKLSEIVKKYKITSVMTFGGEPLLYPEATCIIHKKAEELGIPKRQLITNGYFSKDVQRIKYVSRMIYSSGVNDVLLSVDAFHGETIPVEPVKAFALELMHWKIPVRLNPAWLVSPEDNNEYNIITRELLKEFTSLGIPESEGNIVFPEGNALKYLSEYFDPEKEYSNPYAENPEDIRSISFTPDYINGDV